jgi:hypothetical protein
MAIMFLGLKGDGTRNLIGGIMIFGFLKPKTVPLFA